MFNVVVCTTFDSLTNTSKYVNAVHRTTLTKKGRFGPIKMIMDMDMLIFYARAKIQSFPEFKVLPKRVVLLNYFLFPTTQILLILLHIIKNCKSQTKQ